MSACRTWTIVFAASSVMLSGVILLQLQSDPIGPVASPAPPPKSGQKADISAHKPTLGPVRKYAAIAERPLFTPGRRPTKAPPPPAQPKVGRQSLKSIVLTGILIGPDKKVALIRSTKSPKPQSLGEGATVGGWRLDTVLADRILLSAGDQTAEIAIWDKSMQSRGTKGGLSPGAKTRVRSSDSVKMRR